ncbi:hypothetical protein ALC62_01279 [Cyphomyrmex costatus]|uniref:Uncharacterized protein n=1 Tax=Cyphomyrmex costatus TaxID=456900 RepID=A0A195D4F4_9HYME|nr:hypothetical protein ALC62_01279 [Cyphomyrmex costatus]
MPPPTSINRLTALRKGISFRFWFFPGSLIAPTDLYLFSRILLIPTGEDLSSRASIIFQLPGRTSTRWDSCIPDVIGVGFATVNVTGKIRRPRMAQEQGIKNGYCPGSDVPSRASEDFEEEWSGRRERRNLTRERDPAEGMDFDLRRNPPTINAAITNAIGVIGCVYQSALRNEEGKGWRARIGLVNKGRPPSILMRYEPTGFSLVVGSATCPFYDVIYPRKRSLDKVIP